MLQSIFMAKEENITKSKAITAKIVTGLTPEQKNELLMQLESLTGDVRRLIIQEVLNDINSLGELLRGNFISKRVESYNVEVENLSKVQRYGWEIQVVKGVKMQFDPYKADPVLEPIPKMTVERTRTIYEVSTNRQAISKIEELLQTFLVRVKGEFKHVSIDIILEAKRLVELEISKIDRTVMKKETMNEVDFQDATYIKKPFNRMKAVGPDAALFNSFNSMKAAI